MPTKTFDSLPAQADGDERKGPGNQAIVRKMRAPGFIFVLTAPFLFGIPGVAVPASPNRIANLESQFEKNSIADGAAFT
jgi:hypothetical protein